LFTNTHSRSVHHVHFAHPLVDRSVVLVVGVVVVVLVLIFLDMGIELFHAVSDEGEYVGIGLGS